MFTGIVQAVGEVRELTRKGSDVAVHIAVGKLDMASVGIGDSIAVAGVCLTVTALEPQGFRADVSAETLRCTTFQALQTGMAVNLEKSLTLSTPLGGHLVSGHVDGVAEVRERNEVGESLRYDFTVPADLARYIAAKGSVCIDGVSLTVNEVRGADFSVNIVPHTQRETTLGALKSGAQVNLEVDLMARYAERILQSDNSPREGVRRETLSAAGFIHE